uniref:Protein alan shepard n=1 Tax=Parascaris univalens TaxID=6257 RepID=A0A915BYP5_PARUN
MEGDHRGINHISPQGESEENKAAATNTPDTESEERVNNKQTAEEKPASEVEACNESAEEEVIDEQPLGWDAGAEQAKEVGWGDLPPTNTQAQTASDNGASSWTNSNEQTEEKQHNSNTSNAPRMRSGRRNNGRRAKYTDVTDQLIGFSRLRTQSWASQALQHSGGGHQHTRRSPLNVSLPHRSTIPSSHANSHSVINRSAPLGSSSMSPGVLGQPSASPYQQNMHASGYAYGTQTFSRAQNPYAAYQQQQAISSCNGYGTSGTSTGGQMQRSANRASAAGTVRNNNDSPHSDAPLSSTNVYIRGLDANTTDEDLRQKCDQYGVILSTKAIMDKATGQCKGYGFVDFESAEAAMRAVEGLNQKGKVQAQMAKVSIAQQEQDPTNLYFANLPANFTEQDLQKTLERFGMVISTRILKNQDGASRGVGFARMDKKELCDQIIREMNGKLIINNSTQPLLVKFADSGKKPKTRTLPMASVYSNVAQMEIPQFYTGAQYEQLNGGYIRGNPATFPYIIPAPSQYVLNPQPQYHHVIQGFATDAQLGGLTSQMHNMSLHATNAGVSQQGADVSGGAAGGAMAAAQPAPSSHMPQMAMHPSYTYPIYHYPLHYGMQAPDPSMTAMTMVTSATPPTGYVPTGEMMLHADGASIYANQPPPSVQTTQMPGTTNTVPSK